ncbi:MAG: Xaa-Pro aminopeptidase [Candidatus Sericytochromatia bacterium]|nr:Xaa-Pro aminopeptidase [Candidatus Sericytochromatia bacterium]
MIDFAARRWAYMERIGDGVAILPAAPTFIKTADQEHQYRPDSDLYYLTGFAEPEAVAVLAPHHPDHKFILFVRPRDKTMETWNGRRAGLEGARQRYGADAAYPIDQLDAVLPQYLEGVSAVHYHFGHDKVFNDRVHGWLAAMQRKVRNGITAPHIMVDTQVILHEMRLRKSPDEVALMRRAAEIAAAGHRKAMSTTEPGQREYEVQAELEYVMRKGGAMGPSYGSIVGGGFNATILHYHENSDILNDGDLLLIDAGAEVEYYASDITRTFPVSGTFTAAQREVYEVVLWAQEAALGQCQPGKRFCDVHGAAVRTIVEGLVHLGVLKGHVDDLIAQEAYKPYYMHKTSHWLGMDVHDVGVYKVGGEWRELEPGMVLTVEPGLYFGEDTDSAAARYRGIGIRIEDDVLITHDGYDVLTKDVPKAIDEIEGLMRKRSAAAAMP